MPLRVVIRLLVIESLRSLARNKVRSGLAMLGIAVAVAIVITVIALGRASIAASEAELDKLGDNLVWVEAGSRNAAGVRTGNHGMTTLTARDADAIRQEIAQIKDVSENVDGGFQVVSRERNWQTRWRGVAPSYQAIKRWDLARGAFFDEEQTLHADRVIVIGETVQRELFADIDPIGEVVRIGDTGYEVIGVLAPKGQSPTGQDQDDTVMMPWTTAMKRVVGKDQTWLDDILCSAASSDAMQPAITQIQELLPAREGPVVLDRIEQAEDLLGLLRKPGPLGLAGRLPQAARRICERIPGVRPELPHAVVGGQRKGSAGPRVTHSLSLSVVSTCGGSGSRWRGRMSL